MFLLCSIFCFLAPAHADEANNKTAETDSAVAKRKLLLFPVHAPSLKTEVVNTLTKHLQQDAEELGYETVLYKGKSPYSGGPSTTELWQAAYAHKAHRALSLKVWIDGDRYIGELQVASLDGRGPYHGRANGKNDQFLERTKELIEHLVPSADTWDEQEAAYWARYANSASSGKQESKKGAESSRDLLTPSERLIAQARARRLRHRFSVAAQSESVVAASSNFYYNHLAGMRLNFRFSETLLAGIYIGYLNGSGRNERSHNLLSYAQIEHRIFFSPKSDISLPLRFGLGYLPFNGPVVRTSAGLNLPLHERFELGLDVITPTIWVLPNSTTLSFNFGIELIIKL